MAFPVPDHLPRKGVSQDVSTRILSKISEATTKSLNADLVATWILELEGNITETEDSIYERIKSQLPAFEQQLESSKSVRTRLHDLSTNVDKLSLAFSDPQDGILPNLVRSLSEHRALAQKASDTAVFHEALAYLNQCRDELATLSQLVQDGKLPQAARAVKKLQQVVEDAPEAVRRSDVLVDIKRHHRTMRDNVEEQLSDAYRRSILISSTELKLSPAVQVNPSQSIISLADVLSSLSSSSLAAHLASLKRDLITHFIEYPLQQPVTATISSASDSHGAPLHKIALFPSPLHEGEIRTSTLRYLRTLFDFLSTHLFPSLPNAIASSFPRSLFKPTTDALLHHVLIPSIPSTLPSLPPFLSFVHDACAFEERLLSGLFGETVGAERDVKAWADNVGAHYGRKRRISLLHAARSLIVPSAEHGIADRIFRADLSQEPQTNETNGDHKDDETAEADSSWDFDDPAQLASKSQGVKPDPLSDGSREGTTEEEGGGWDFDDDTPQTEPPIVKIVDPADTTREEEGSSDAWGWNDNADIKRSGDDVNGHAAPSESTVRTDEPAEDDPSVWDDAWNDPVLDPEPDPVPSPPPVTKAAQPKLAKGLEKHSGKAKIGTPEPLSSASWNTSSTPASASSSRFVPVSPLPASSRTNVHRSQPSWFAQAESSKAPVPPPPMPKRKETYSVSGRAKDLVSMVSDILAEARAVALSDVFDALIPSTPNTPGSSTSTGTSTSASSSSPSVLILQTVPYVLDLYRALFPVVAGAELARHADRAMRFANDCRFVSMEVARLEVASLPFPNAGKVLHDSVERLRKLGEWWYEDLVEKQRASVRRTLERADGFSDTGDQERFDECEAIMTDVLRAVRTVGHQWKLVLPPSKYFSAIGSVVDAALAKLLEDILALSDIPELDSKRLSELCRILNALEGLFYDDSDPELPSVVVAYVPSWLKYSYLSELLEASLADIMYLFDEGALIDFDVEELARLIRALFADTPQRTNTIAKVMRGHPAAAL